MKNRREYPILSLLPAKHFHSCVLTTFSFDFNYFNHDALAGLSRAGVRNICILLDDTMLQQYLGCLSGYSGSAAKRYSLSGIVHPGAFHPKLSLFFGRNGHGFLIIGSGNLTAAGHGRNQELWGAFHIKGPHDPKAALFKEAWEYVKKCSAETPGVSRQKFEWIETHTPWLQDISVPEQTYGYDIGKGVEAFFLTNQQTGILSNIGYIVKENVKECTIISPFFDNQTAALLELEHMYPKARIHVLIQPNTVKGNLSRNEFRRTSFYDWNTLTKDTQLRYLHAKFLHIQTDNAEYCLLGSANLTAPALGTSHIKPSNEEACLLFRRAKGNWLEELGLNKKWAPIHSEDIKNHEIETPKDNQEKETKQYRLSAIDRIGTNLYVYYTKPRPDFENTRLSLFDGWGERQKLLDLAQTELETNDEFLRITADSIEEDILYGQLFDTHDTAISNKQIVHDMAALSRTNPDPKTQQIEGLLDQIDLMMSKLLKY
ncbi:hypothetical protein [Chitinivibrio alkaliphilus]|uniref:PLD phosphodiesterase domain-containing protein n=1 Tax=Chitinivibrio alkaliphilus ACht1 TaxID=1313304 RepID=U7D9I7_9BACT|nr:hypothetical protein [Chitinivibrio alkaliphilus]ERP31752.1 hypothetical protein CALK_1417 [Chitinivibrio alkaliphilus ACht1]